MVESECRNYRGVNIHCMQTEGCSGCAFVILSLFGRLNPLWLGRTHIMSFGNNKKVTTAAHVPEAPKTKSTDLHA